MFFIFQNWHDHNFLHYDDIIMFLIFTIIATANIYAFTLFLALDTGRVDQFSCLDTIEGDQAGRAEYGAVHSVSALNVSADHGTVRQAREKIRADLPQFVLQRFRHVCWHEAADIAAKTGNFSHQ